MKVKLLEVELGASDPEKSKTFYETVLGIKPAIEQPNLKVFNLKANHVDFNVSTHLKPQETSITFLTDNLNEVMEHLKSENIVYDGPTESHLAMLSINFRDPDGQLIKINQATEQSPKWLTFE